VGCVERLAVLRNAETVSKGNEHGCMATADGRLDSASITPSASLVYIGRVRGVYVLSSL
jgi:hypothetical protein